GQSYPFQIQPHINYTSGVYSYQGRVVNELLDWHTVRLTAPCGAGKTVLACLFAGILQEGPILFLAEKDRLLRQFINTVESVLGIPSSEVGLIKADKFILKPITAASLRTVGKETFDINQIKD